MNEEMNEEKTKRSRREDEEKTKRRRREDGEKTERRRRQRRDRGLLPCSSARDVVLIGTLV